MLVTHDMKRARINGRASLTGVVTDDRLNELITALPSRNVWIIVDSCHSGTVTRSFSLKNRSLARDAVYVKSFNYTGMPAPATRQHSRSIVSRSAPGSAKGPENFVSLTAAADGEEAIGTSKGGVFTIGLTEAFARLSAQGKKPTVEALKEEATAYIKSKVDKAQVHTPQLNGNAQLANGALQLVAQTPVAAGQGPNRTRLIELVGRQSASLKLDVQCAEVRRRPAGLAECRGAIFGLPERRHGRRRRRGDGDLPEPAADPERRATGHAAHSGGVHGFRAARRRAARSRRSSRRS